MFYDNIYKICNEKGTTPTTVLKELGFSSGNVSKWKKGSVPNVDIAYQIAQHLGVSMDYLVTGQETHVHWRFPVWILNGSTLSLIFQMISRKCAKTFFVPIWLFQKSTQTVKGDNIITIFYMAKKSLP